MNAPATPNFNANVVHESETQRQHVRVRLPGTIEFDGGRGPARLPLDDVSMGGIGFNAKNQRLQVGQRCEGTLNIRLSPITVSLPVRFEVRHHDPGSGRSGASFMELAPPEIATLRRIVTAHLAGEVISAGELMNTLSRNNFTVRREPKPKNTRRSVRSRTRAMVLTALMLTLGVAAFGYVAQRVHTQLFGATAVAARVSGPRYSVTMPREGIFRSLVPEDGVVKKGAPIGTFESSMLDLVRGQALDANLTPQQLEQMLNKSAKGTITSPCDCRVLATYAADEQQVAKGQPLFDLAPMKFNPYVVARFRYPEASRLSPGTPVEFRIAGGGARKGRITQLRQGGPEELSEAVVAVVQPEEPIDMELLYKPVKVSATDTVLPRFSSVVNDAVAEGRP